MLHDRRTAKRPVPSRLYQLEVEKMHEIGMARRGDWWKSILWPMEWTTPWRRGNSGGLHMLQLQVKPGRIVDSEVFPSSIGRRLFDINTVRPAVVTG